VDPQLVPGHDSNVEKISAGETHSCSIKNNNLLCWGGNYNQGQGTVVDNSPVKVISLSKSLNKSKVILTAGKDLTCLVSQNKLRCFMKNETLYDKPFLSISLNDLK